MVIYFIEKTNGVNSKHPTLKNTNSPIMSMLAINRNCVFCAYTSACNVLINIFLINLVVHIKIFDEYFCEY